LEKERKNISILSTFGLTRDIHDVVEGFWESVYIFEKYSLRQIQRCISLLPQLRSKVKMRPPKFTLFYGFLT